MAREEPLNPKIEKGLEWKIGAYTPSLEDQLIDREEEEAERSEAEKAEIKRAQRKALCDLLDRSYGVLPCMQYNVLYMIYVCGMNTGQVAEYLDKSPGAVRTSHCRGKKKLLALFSGRSQSLPAKQRNKPQAL